MVGHEPMRHRIAASIVGLVLGALLCLGIAGAGPAAARTIDVTQSAELRLVRKSGSVLYERGTASGTLPGSVSARFVVNVLKVTGDVTFYPRAGGSITFRAEGFPKSSGARSRVAGTMAIVGGTGRYANARGGATFNGVVNRRSWAVSVSATGRMRY